MKTVNEVIERLDYTIEEFEKDLIKKKNETGDNFGMSAIQRTIEIEKIQAEIKAYKEIRLYMKL